MAKLIQFGAGNIGRSFIGQIFSGAGFEVVFVDVDEALVAAINRERHYRVVVKHGDRPDSEIYVGPVRAISGKDPAAVIHEMETASLVCTSVGKAALNHVLPVIADGILRRAELMITVPFDIIFAENIRNVAVQAREILTASLPVGFPFDTRVGLVESSIGKMVPIMKQADIESDTLWVFAESYNTLILDAHGFRNPIPDVPEIKAVDNIQAYVDRKLFIHNMGHAAAAYLGFQFTPDATTIWEALESPAVFDTVRRGMRQSADALHAGYPEALTREALEEHIEDLLHRFRNRALGDTIFRVGRDLPRKLHREDRLTGAMLLAARHQQPFDAIALAAAAAFDFRATDEHNRPDPGDMRFHCMREEHGLDACLTTFCGLVQEDPIDLGIAVALRGAHARLYAEMHRAGNAETTSA